jgi:hypothetical protein
MDWPGHGTPYGHKKGARLTKIRDLHIMYGHENDTDRQTDTTGIAQLDVNGDYSAQRATGLVRISFFLSSFLLN